MVLDEQTDQLSKPKMDVKKSLEAAGLFVTSTMRVKPQHTMKRMRLYKARLGLLSNFKYTSRIMVINSHYGLNAITYLGHNFLPY